MNKMDVFIIGLILGSIGIYYFMKYYKSFIIRKRLKKAKRGEINAIRFLEDNGYSIIGIQEKKTIITWINNQPYNNQIKVDYLVKKKGKVYIAEVKTGKLAPRPNLADTRRQLLEYYLAFGTHGIILVDMEKKKLQKISFSITDVKRRWSLPMQLALAGLFGLACGWFLYHYIYGGLFW